MRTIEYGFGPARALAQRLKNIRLAQGARTRRRGMKDRQGTEIEVGCIVAYNLSGAVALGEVLDISRGYRYDSQKLLHFKIRPFSAWVRLASKTGVSKVSCIEEWSGRTYNSTDKIVVLKED